MPLNHKTSVAGEERFLEAGFYRSGGNQDYTQQLHPTIFLLLSLISLLHLNKQETESGLTLS